MSLPAQWPKPTSAAKDLELQAAIDRFGHSRYQDGLDRGLAVAEKLAGYLTGRRTSKQEIRQWALVEIDKAKKEPYRVDR